MEKNEKSNAVTKVYGVARGGFFGDRQRFER